MPIYDSESGECRSQHAISIETIIDKSIRLFRVLKVFEIIIIIEMIKLVITVRFAKVLLRPCHQFLQPLMLKVKYLSPE